MATEQRYLTRGMSGTADTTAGLYNSLLRAAESVMAFSGTFPTVRVKTRLELLIDELDALRLRRDPAFRPSKHAYRSAKFYIFETYAKMRNSFPTPTFVLDGERGIILKWTHNGYTVRLNCLPDLGDQNYIYFENGEFDIEDNVTPDLLQQRLNWLMQHEREPAR